MKKLFVLACLLSAGLAHAQTSTLEWASHYAGDGYEVGCPVAVDNNGNTYAIVYYDAIVDLDPGPGSLTVTSTGGYDFAVTKVDASGNFQWARSITGPMDQLGMAMRTDNSGNVYVTGTFLDNTDFDPGVGVTNLYAADDDVFVLKLTSAGNLGWARQFVGSSLETAASLAIDNSGNVLSTGYFDGSVDFDPGLGTTNVSATGFGDTYISKLDNNGNFVYVKILESGSSVNSSHMVTDGSGNIFVTGYFDGTTDFDPGAGVTSLAPSGSSGFGGFVVKLNNSGTFQFVKEVGSDPVRVGVDGAGNIYLGGSFNGVVDFDPGPGIVNLTATLNDYFIVKLNNAGSYQWAHNSGSPDNANIYAMTVDNAGNVTVGGTFENSIDLDHGAGTFNVLSAGDEDVFLSRFSTAGNFVWGGALQGETTEILVDMDTDAQGNIYAGGFHISTELDLDPGPGSFTVGTTNLFFDLEAFAIKVSICDLSPDSLSSPVLCSGGTALLGATSTGTVSWYATAGSTVALASGTAFTTPALTTGTHTFFAGSSGCSMAGRIPITLTVHPLPQLTFIANPSISCIGQVVTFSLGGAPSFSVNGITSAGTFTGAPVTNTTYMITGESAESCKTSASFSHNVQDCTGLENQSRVAFHLYPNPASSQVMVETSSASHLRLYTLQGQLIAEQTLNAGSNAINTADLPRGIYIMALSASTGQTTTQKLILE